MPAPELAQRVLNGPGTSVWHEGVGQAVQLSSRHHDAGDLISRMSTGLESAWTGRAADAAQTRIRALAEIASVSAAIYTTNGANLSDVAHGFDAMKTSLQPMPDKPPHLTFLDRVSPWDTDAEKEINQYNAVAQQNVERYQAYVQHARTGSQQLQTDYGRLDDFGGRSNTAESQMKARQSPGEAPYFPQPRNSGHPRNSVPPVSGPSASPPGPGTTQAASENPGMAPGTGDHTTVSGWSPDPATAKVPPADAPHTGGSTGVSDTGTSGIPAQGTAGNVGDRTGRTTSGSPESNRPGEPRSRTRNPSPRPGTGRGTGEEGRATNTPTRSTRGAPGATGLAPSRGKGKDEDSKDHHRKYGLETDSAFSLTDEDGDRTVDPRTGLPPTPPTIGG
ncbi:hypothetical protein ACWEHA_04665 [Amycolatopsis nivea]